MSTTNRPDRYKSEGQCRSPYCKNKGKFVKINNDGLIIRTRFCKKHSKDPKRPQVVKSTKVCEKCGRELGNTKYRIKKNPKKGYKEGNILTVCVLCKRVQIAEQNIIRNKKNKTNKIINNLRKSIKLSQYALDLLLGKEPVKFIKNKSHYENIIEEEEYKEKRVNLLEETPESKELLERLKIR
jgi:hypothetical protein